MNFHHRAGAKSVKNTQLICTRVVPKDEPFDTKKSKFELVNI